MKYMLIFLLVMAVSTQAMAAKTFVYSKWVVVAQNSGDWQAISVPTYAGCLSTAASMNTGSTTAWCSTSPGWSRLKHYIEDPASNMAAIPGFIDE